MQPPGEPSDDHYPVPTALQVNADASSSRMPRTAIDPTLLPLPGDHNNEDFPDFQNLLKQAVKPATKVAGSHRPSLKAWASSVPLTRLLLARVSARCHHIPMSPPQRSLKVAMLLERILTRQL